MILPEQANPDTANLDTSEPMAESSEATTAADSLNASLDTASADLAALYERIQSFDIDTVEDALSFSQRLAKDNNWSLKFALSVIEEYKRFVFLAVAADHPATPSDQVDQVWHLHLTYSRSYWEDFCPNILKMSLHHEPTKGGDAESEKFDHWYEQTLASYEQFFGEAPPEQIWPAADLRFGRDNAFIRVNTQQQWVIPKLPVSREVLGSVIAVLIVGMGLYVMLNTASGANVVGVGVITVLSAIAGYSIIQTGAGFLDALHRPSRGGGWGTGGCGGCAGCGGGCCGCGGGGCGGC